VQGITVQHSNIQYEATSAILGRNDVIGGERAGVGTNILRLDLVLTATADAHVNQFVTVQHLLIVIDGRSYEPYEYDYDTMNPGTSLPMVAKYSVPEAVTSFDLLFPGPSDSPVRASVDTANASLVPESN
jgi:hypothetical protein